MCPPNTDTVPTSWYYHEHLKLGLWSVVQDETIKYQAALRTMDIFAKKHSVQHDIITGHPLVANYTIPSKPEPM